MRAEDNRRMMEGYLAALRSGGDFAQYFTEDVRWTTVETGDQLRGRDAVRDHIVALHTQALDAHPEVRNLVVGDGGALLEADLVGTHTGEFAGVPATGASVRVPYAVVYDLSPNGITAIRAYLPVMQMAQQLREAQAPAR
ncbi:ester cyclase [Aquipuribacter sp. MA13-6]|uniref:ester cyclase n=1 Tax=unclassified Aquipuribacter TaxID=2635084 RepID=UPI003EE8230D